jgi:hypothetical protein
MGSRRITEDSMNEKSFIGSKDSVEYKRRHVAKARQGHKKARRMTEIEADGRLIIGSDRQSPVESSHVQWKWKQV